RFRPSRHGGGGPDLPRRSRAGDQRGAGAAVCGRRPRPRGRKARALLDPVWRSREALVTARVLPFPASPILRAVRQLERPVSAEAERMAASVLIEALVTGEPAPPGTLRLVCSTL